jgi:NhaA family Na+:H+ antiporter
MALAASMLVGKAVGITAFSFLAVQSKIAGMADDLTWAGIAGIAMLAGVGFTVALFISGLYFADENSVAAAKVAVLAASLAAGAIGYPSPLVKRQLSTILEKTDASGVDRC